MFLNEIEFYQNFKGTCETSYKIQKSNLHLKPIIQLGNLQITKKTSQNKWKKYYKMQHKNGLAKILDQAMLYSMVQNKMIRKYKTILKKVTIAILT